jgi:cell wall-associated NlpC family hydrolase
MKKTAAVLSFILLLSLFLVSCASFKGARASRETREAVVRAAKDMLDKKYVYGAKDNHYAFDCSGLTQFAYGEAGIKIPRTSAEQYRRCNRVDVRDIEKGDLLFFSTNGGGASHVGIYIGDGLFIHSPSEGKRVQKVKFADRYWHDKFYGAGNYF